MRLLLRALPFVSLLLAGCASTDNTEDTTETIVSPAAPEVEAPRLPDQRVTEMNVQVNELLDRVEVLNARIQKLESGSVAPGPAVAAAPAPATQQPREATVPLAPVRNLPAATPEVSVRRDVRTEAPRAGAVIADQYRNALTLYGRGKLDDARKAFEMVFDADSGGELADNALYWIAETYFVTARYREAMKYYQRIEADYSDQNKAPDALLKVASAHAKSGDLALARGTYQKLVAKYPYSTAAAAAKMELKRIRY